jgi:hypothetical protein
MNIDRCLHICDPNCASHVQPSFQSLVHAARDALQSLFLPWECLMGSIQEIPAYPTRDQLFHTRVVGLAQFELYFSYQLLSRERKTEVSSATPVIAFPSAHFVCLHTFQHSITSRPGLANARLQLAERTEVKLIWNYLPEDVARRAAAKLAPTVNACEFPCLYCTKSSLSSHTSDSRVVWNDVCIVRCRPRVLS